MNATPMTAGPPPLIFTIATIGVTIIIASPAAIGANGKFVDRGRRISFLTKGAIRLCGVAAALLGRLQIMDMDSDPTPTGRAEG